MTAEPVPSLVIRGLRKRYGATQALAGVDLVCHAGEIVALMGANGAGKSTLVKILSGVTTPDGGTVTLRGRVIAPASPAEAQAAGILAVHQSVADVGVASMTVAENLLLDRFCSGATPALIRPRSARRTA